MQAVDLIRKKRNGNRLNRSELEFLLSGYVNGEIPDYQMAAWSMAVYFQGMDPQEITDLTLLMAASGDTIDLSEIEGVKVDKHSTGGVADTTSLLVIPLVASCGIPVAKMSGRGLGHTGGTVDKLESIPGYQVELEPSRFIDQVNKIGVGLVGQTGELAPADKLLYSLRDVTATVESIPLIASSIMSKKIAAGADGFVLDVKAGTGAFMKSESAAIELAKTMVDIGTLANRSSTAIISDMNQPLGTAIGNALEVKEAILALHGNHSDRLTELSLELSAEMLLLARFTTDKREARRLLESKLANKDALLKFAELIRAQGGDARVLEDPSLLPQARFIAQVTAPNTGYVHIVDPLQLGKIAMDLGAGRLTKETQIDLAVGLEIRKRVGDKVQAGEPLATIYANDESLLAESLKRVPQAFVIKDELAAALPLIYRKITAKDV